MKKKVLFLVHVEEMFRHFFPDEMYVKRLIRSVKAKKYDRVILLDSGLDEIIAEVENAKNGHTEVWDWGWGYEPETFCDDPDTCEDEDCQHHQIISARGHSFTWIPLELQKEGIDYFQQVEVFVGGGCSSECLADFEDVLDHLQIEYTRVWGLVY